MFLFVCCHWHFIIQQQQQQKACTYKRLFPETYRIGQEYNRTTEKDDLPLQGD